MNFFRLEGGYGRGSNYEYENENKLQVRSKMTHLKNDENTIAKWLTKEQKRHTKMYKKYRA